MWIKMPQPRMASPLSQRSSTSEPRFWIKFLSELITTVGQSITYSSYGMSWEYNNADHLSSMNSELK